MSGSIHDQHVLLNMIMKAGVLQRTEKFLASQLLKENFVRWWCLYLLVRYLKQGLGAEFFLCSVDCLIISLTTKIIGVAVNRRCSSPSYSPTFKCCRNIFSKSYFSVLFFRLVSRFLYKKSFNQGTWSLFISRCLIHCQNCQAVSLRE